MGELRDGGQELDDADGVAHRVVEAEGQDEAAAEQTGHLEIERL